MTELSQLRRRDVLAVWIAAKLGVIQFRKGERAPRLLDILFLPRPKR